MLLVTEDHDVRSTATTALVRLALERSLAVAVLSTHQYEADLRLQLLARESGLSTDAIVSGTLAAEEWERLRHAERRLESSALVFLQSRGNSVGTLALALERQRAGSLLQRGVPPGLVVVEDTGSLLGAARRSFLESLRLLSRKERTIIVAPLRRASTSPGERAVLAKVADAVVLPSHVGEGKVLVCDPSGREKEHSLAEVLDDVLRISPESPVRS